MKFPKSTFLVRRYARVWALNRKELTHAKLYTQEGDQQFPTVPNTWEFVPLQNPGLSLWSHKKQTQPCKLTILYTGNSHCVCEF